MDPNVIAICSQVCQTGKMSRFEHLKLVLSPETARIWVNYGLIVDMLPDAGAGRTRPSIGANGRLRAMFSGIVEEVGKVRSYDLSRMTVEAVGVLQDLKVSDSISVAGVCLTVVELADGAFTVETVPETVDRSNFGALTPGRGVNLERALALGDRIGGHMVQGHVDGRGELASAIEDGNSVRIRINCDPDLLRYIVEKGFITVDGTSLTVTAVHANGFEVAIIPFTFEHTTLNERAVGDAVNIEVDVTAKYVEKLVSPYMSAIPVAAGVK